MNDKIYELIKQSEVSIGHPKCFSGYIDLEKFAKSIMKECIVDYYRRYLDICSDEDITVQVDRYVKEHFGVEE